MISSSTRLGGDREAFGQIVARYQTVICALAFSACGDMARSEDLAQDIFITAWRNLSKLKDPARLKAWLCGIARNTINYSFREDARDPITSSEPFEESLAGCAEADSAADQAMSKEESALLWRVLEGLPRAYRDPMVLFYRNDESVSEVADAMELSEEAVRQRLSRGRSMLNERLSRLVVSGLRRSGPSSGFSLAVLAALPIAGTQASAAGVAATAAQTAGTTKAAGLLASILSFVLPAISVLGGLASLWGRVQNTRSPGERRFVLLSTIGLLAWAGVFLFGALYFVSCWHPQPTTRVSDAVAVALFWIALCGPLDAYAIWIGLRQKQLRGEHPRSDAIQVNDALRKGHRTTMYGALAAMIFGLASWLMLLAFHGRDYLTFGLTFVLATAAWLTAARKVVREPKTVERVYIAVLWGLCLYNLALGNLRWEAWTGGSLSEFPDRPAPLGINIIIITFFATIRLGWFLKARMLKTTNVRPWVLRASLVYIAVLLLGAATFFVLRGAEGAAPTASQTLINDILSDGTIRFQSICETPNQSSWPLSTYRFVNSDCVQVDKMLDREGLPLAFTSRHNGTIFEYYVTLNSPIPPGQMVYLESHGTFSGQIHSPSPGEYVYREQHWPANGMQTRRVEIYHLPESAQVLAVESPSLQTRALPDGRTELRIEKLIPPGGNIVVEIHYKLASSR